MSSSSATERDLQTLELEVVHLARALSKLRRNTPEWSFLNQKLEAAEEELDGLRGGGGGDGVLVDVGYDEDEDDDEDDGGRDDADGVEYVGYRDDPSGYRDRPPRRYRDDPYGDDDDAGFEQPVLRPSSSPRNRRKFSRILAPQGRGRGWGRGWNHRGDDDDELPPDDGKLTFSEGYDVDRGIPKAHPARRFGLVLGGMFCAVVLSCVIIVALSLGGDPRGDNSHNNQAAADSGGRAHAPQIAEPCASFSMHLVPDRFGNETSWELVRYDDDAVVLAGGPYAYKGGFDRGGAGAGGAGGSHYEMVHASTCLPRGSYGFVLRDAGGDGICCVSSVSLSRKQNAYAFFRSAAAFPPGSGTGGAGLRAIIIGGAITSQNEARMSDPKIYTDL